ncbi:MAG: hypothetical protein LQ350_008401 [Teloschistes chrysophthalmus]|nr:MAG: hypothetical protein LQ350_008401 [Niorma chrysophthalma]
MGSTIINPRLSLRGGSASLKRRDARKRRFNLCREPIARNENGLEASKDKTGEGSTARRSHESTLDALQDHDVQATAEEVNLSSHCMAAPEDAERQSTGLNKHTSQRFIVFVGNLPYSATEESIRQHFANLTPLSVRHRCDKDSGRSKGFAFLEFHNFDRMKTCLKTLHHSSFEDGISPARSINVELTVGGGGSKSKDRRLKLKAKNEKLKQERARRRLEQTKIKKGRKQMQNDVSKQGDNGDVHPSRRARLAAPQ